MMKITQPVYCVTSDIDWASGYCIADFLDLMKRLGVTPTLFATHEDSQVRQFALDHPHDVGIHPNFRMNSTHGSDMRSVVDHVFRLFPGAKAFRSHAYHDSSELIQEMAERGVLYDSNLCLFLQPNIVPLRLAAAQITRFPVFWEDDCHWLYSSNDWKIDHFIAAFSSPGLKIINVHPFLISLNVPSAGYYSNLKQYISGLTSEQAKRLRFPGIGCRNFLESIVLHAKSHGYPFLTLREVYQKFPVHGFSYY